jgi:hypothetical protein
VASAVSSATAPAPPVADRVKSDLGPAARRLVELIQSVYFGRVERLVLRDGQPIFDPAPRVVRTLKLGGSGRNVPRPQAGSEDFPLKKEVVELLDQLELIGDGIVSKIEILHGLPMLLELEQDDVFAGGKSDGRGR